MHCQNASRWWDFYTTKAGDYLLHVLFFFLERNGCWNAAYVVGVAADVVHLFPHLTSRLMSVAMMLVYDAVRMLQTWHTTINSALWFPFLWTAARLLAAPAVARTIAPISVPLGNDILGLILDFISTQQWRSIRSHNTTDQGLSFKAPQVLFMHWGASKYMFLACGGQREWIISGDVWENFWIVQSKRGKPQP